MRKCSFCSGYFQSSLWAASTTRLFSRGSQVQPTAGVRFAQRRVRRQLRGEDRRLRAGDDLWQRTCSIITWASIVTLGACDGAACSNEGESSRAVGETLPARFGHRTVPAALARLRSFFAKAASRLGHATQNASRNEHPADEQRNSDGKVGPSGSNQRPNATKSGPS